MIARLGDNVPEQVWAIDETGHRIENLQKFLPPDSTIVRSNPLAAQLPNDVALCIIASEASRIPDVIEELLYERLPSVLMDGALVAFPFCRDTSVKSLTKAGVFASTSHETLQLFLNEQFGTTRIEPGDDLRTRFSSCEIYQFVDWAPSSRKGVKNDAIIWIALRKREKGKSTLAAAVGRDPQTNTDIAFPRTRRTNQYLLRDFESLIARMLRAKIVLKGAEDFARLNENSSGVGLLKFDIHGNMRRPVEMARILNSFDVPGLFLMMPRNPINEDFFDNRETWNRLHEIRDLGHEIGMHPDVFYLIRRYGNLYTGLDASLSEFAKRGFTIRSATVHGDTRSHIKVRKMQANDFFAEKFRRTKWNGQPPKGEEMLSEHVFKYSYKKIATDFGIRFFPEINFVADGELMAAGVQAYLTDNSRSFELRGTKDGRHKIRSSTPFRLTPRFARECVNELRTKRFLALFHPQWYW